ncbi:hypothetical protein D8T58_16910 [Vibrio vulnificus]|nr:hypothetical protein D8T58_16910 [Vibrio vulnificus]
MLKRQRQGMTIINRFLKAVFIYRGLPSNIYYIAIARMILGTEESPDDLDKNHQVKVDAHLVM